MLTIPIRRALWTTLWLVAAVTAVPLMRMRMAGTRNVPREGPALLLLNHNHFMDPVIGAWATWRRVHIVGTDQLLRVPLFGPLLTWLSVIPFARGMKDKEAMGEINRRFTDEKAIVLISPEGGRSWTGRLLPLRAGTARLAKRLGVPVLYCRVLTAHMAWPRWARYPRFMPIRGEYLPTRTYTDDMSDQQVVDDMVKHLSIDLDAIEAPRWSFGVRLAWGLPEFLWACPSCFELGGLQVHPKRSDVVCCSSCEGTWRLDLSCRLHAETDGAEDTTVDRAYQSVLAHFGELPLADAERFERDGVVLECDATHLELVQRGVVEPQRLGVGRVQLLADRITFESMDGDVVGEVALAEVKAVLIQVGSRLQLRTEDSNFQGTPGDQSIHMWKYFVEKRVAERRAARAEG